MSDLRDKLVKLAYNNPEIRDDLLPILKESAETFECPECGSNVLKNTGYCMKCEEKVEEEE